jgi:hypothetical protein
VPLWERENRGMTQEQAQAYKDEVERIGRTGNKAADTAAVNLAGNGVLQDKSVEI